MALVPYCSNDEVRAALGVSISELSDAVLDLPIYESSLRRELVRVSSTLPSVFLAIDGNPPTARTADEQDLYDCASAFAILSVARHIGGALPMMAPKTLTDDKAGFGRFSDEAYKTLLSDLEVRYQAAKADLVSAASVLSGSGATSLTSAIGFIASKNSYDPVTG